MLAADVAAAAGAFRLRAAVEVERGRTLVLFGASGAGKSLLLRTIAGIHPARGRITLDGEALLDSARGLEVPRSAAGWATCPRATPSSPT